MSNATKGAFGKCKLERSTEDFQKRDSARRKKRSEKKARLAAKRRELAVKVLSTAKEKQEVKQED